MHGLEGGLRIFLFPEYQEALDTVEFVFLGLDGSHVPFYIDELRFDRDLIVFLEDVTSPAEASRYIGIDLYLASDEVVADQTIQSELQYDFLEGYLLKDQEVGVIGSIKEILSYPQQEMALVEYHHVDLLIPIHEALIISLNKEDQEITMSLPDGILQL